MHNDAIRKSTIRIKRPAECYEEAILCGLRIKENESGKDVYFDNVCDIKDLIIYLFKDLTKKKIIDISVYKELQVHQVQVVHQVLQVQTDKVV